MDQGKPSALHVAQKWLAHAEGAAGAPQHETRMPTRTEGVVSVRRRGSLTYHSTALVVANDTLSFGTGLQLGIGDVHSVDADLLAFELKLATAQGLVRIRTLSAEKMQMWMRAVPPTSYRNATAEFATEPIVDSARCSGAVLPLPPDTVPSTESGEGLGARARARAANQRRAALKRAALSKSEELHGESPHGIAIEWIERSESELDGDACDLVRVKLPT